MKNAHSKHFGSLNTYTLKIKGDFNPSVVV